MTLGIKMKSLSYLAAVVVVAMLMIQGCWNPGDAYPKLERLNNRYIYWIATPENIFIVEGKADQGSEVIPTHIDRIGRHKEWIFGIPDPSAPSADRPAPLTHSRAQPDKILKNAHLVATIDLLPDWRYLITTVERGAEPVDIKVPISQLTFAAETSADYYTIIYADSQGNADASMKWNTIVSTAERYAFAQFRAGQRTAENWPNSTYDLLGVNGTSNNSNTFSRVLAHSIGRNADVVQGWHPGNASPQAVHDSRPAPVLRP